MRLPTLIAVVALAVLAATPTNASPSDHRKMLGFFDNLFGKPSPPPASDPALGGNAGFPLVGPVIAPDVTSSASAGNGGAAASTSASIVINGDGNTVTQNAGSIAVVTDNGNVNGDGPAPTTSPSPPSPSPPSPSPRPSPSPPSPSPSVPTPAPSPGPGGDVWWAVDVTYGQPKWDVMAGTDVRGADLIGCDGKTVETEQPDLERCMGYCFSLKTCFAATFDGKRCWPKLEHGYAISPTSSNFASAFYTGPTETIYSPGPSGCASNANYFKL